jgi:nicotinamide riboside kinase
MYKIAILGPESSGKTTLARKLSDKLDAVFIEEYARDYFHNRDYSICNLNDLESIALKQFHDAHKNYNKKFLVSDTEILTIEIWAIDKFGIVPDLILNLRGEQKFDLYILTKPDIPWEYDPLRTDSNRRDYLFDVYMKHIEQNSFNYIVVGGDINFRIESILKNIENC